MLERHFGDVWLGGVDAAPHVKADFDARRLKANKLLKLDVFDLRHRMPHEWYVWAYTRLLPLAYRLVARDDTGGVPASPPTTGSSPTTPTTRRWCCSPSARAAAPGGRLLCWPSASPAASGRASRPWPTCWWSRARAHRRRPGGPRRRGPGRPRLPTTPRPLRPGHPGRRTAPSTARRWPRWPSPTDGPGRPQRHHAPGHRHRHDRGQRDALADTDDIVVLAIPLLTAAHRETVGLDMVVVVDCPTDVALERLLSPAWLRPGRRRGPHRGPGLAGGAGQGGRLRRGQLR